MSSHTAQLWGGLNVARVSDMSEDERGGSAVVVLHGWGAPGDDLVPLAEALARPGVRFFVPAGPLPEMGGGRAWWHLDPNARPPHASTDELTRGFQPTPAVIAARAAVQALIATVVDRHAPATVALVGFSQGAMLAIDVALAGAPGRRSRGGDVGGLADGFGAGVDGAAPEPSAVSALSWPPRSGRALLERQ